MSTTSAQKSTTTRTRTATAAAGTGAVLLTVVSVLAGQSAAFAAEAPVGLGTAGSYSVLGGQTVTNTGPTQLGAGLGVSPGSAITGFPAGIAGDAGTAQAAQAQADVVTAYNDAASRTPTEILEEKERNLVGRTLGPRVYNSPGALSLSTGGTLTLDGQGDPNAVFVFQAASSLITESASDVNLIGEAQACNVYWQVGSSATLGTYSSFTGTILALTSVTAKTGADVEGRALARDGAVTLDSNTFSAPRCAPVLPEPAPVPSESAIAAPVPTESATATPVSTESATATPAPTETAPVSATPVPESTPEATEAATGTNRGINIDSAASAASPSAVSVVTGIAAAVLAVVAAAGFVRRPSRKN